MSEKDDLKELDDRLVEVMEFEENENALSPRARQAKRHEKQQARHRATLGRFLGPGPRHTGVRFTSFCYEPLMVWAAFRVMERQGWQVKRTLPYHDAEPLYCDIATSPHDSVNCLGDGQLLLVKDTERLILTISVLVPGPHSLCAEAPRRSRATVEDFLAQVDAVMEKENFYRGQVLEFQGRLSFLEPGARDFESIVLDPEVQREVRDNTVGFLEARETWSRFGIPLRRGVLLAGEPGTGKTILCKAILGAARGMTGILVSAYHIDDDGYISHVYRVARDLAPSIVIIEDIDILAQERATFGYARGPALLALLAEMDGIAEQAGIVTVATTNHLETMDKALRERPSRFDRVIRLTLPDEAARRRLIHNLAGRIPLAPALQDYLARHTPGATPAQIQEMMFSLVIESKERLPASGLPAFTPAQLDGIIRRVRGTGDPRLGFLPLDSEARREARAPFNSNDIKP